MRALLIPTLVIAAAQAAMAADARPLTGKVFDLSDAASKSAIARISFSDTSLIVIADGSKVQFPLVSEQAGRDGIAFAAANQQMHISMTGLVQEDRISGSIIEEGRTLAFVGALAAAGSAVAETSDLASMLAKARELKLQRKPKPAIDLYLKVIDDGRFALETSAPALVDLVQCFQLLKDDAGSARRFREVAGRLLSAPPPLDGTSTIDLDAAEEDLLWKSWPKAAGGPASPLLVFSVDKVEQSRRMQGGVVSVSLEVMIKVAVPPGMHLIAPDGLRRQDADRAAVTITLADGSTHVSKSANAFVGGDVVYLSLSFDGLPAGTKELASLGGSLKLSQQKGWQLKQMPLREGETWETPEQSCTLTSVTRQGDEVTVEIAQKSHAAGGGGSSSSSSSSGGGNMDSPLWLVDAADNRFYPHTCRSSATGALGTLRLSFSDAGKAQTLVHRIVAKSSEHDVPFTLTHVELP